MLLVLKSALKINYIEGFNIGVKPTFHDPNKAEVVIEVNIFDFVDNIMVNSLTVNWHHCLRPQG
ncbi:riboflavin kinase [Staphylococcus aureus]